MKIMGGKVLSTISLMSCQDEIKRDIEAFDPSVKSADYKPIHHKKELFRRLSAPNSLAGESDFYGIWGMRPQRNG